MIWVTQGHEGVSSPQRKAPRLEQQTHDGSVARGQGTVHVSWSWAVPTQGLDISVRSRLPGVTEGDQRLCPGRLSLGLHSFHHFFSCGEGT